MKIAIVGSGISGLSAFWLLNQHHDVVLFEKDDRPGGHSNTVEVDTSQGNIPVDTGFIVYNVKNYPNLIQLFDYLKVQTEATDMSFSVSRDNGEFEYSGGTFGDFLPRHQTSLNRYFGRCYTKLCVSTRKAAIS